MTLPKRPTDINCLTYDVVAETVGAKEKIVFETKNKNAVSLGQKGGKARANSLTAEERSKIATKAAETRWKD